MSHNRINGNGNAGINAALKEGQDRHTENLIRKQVTAAIRAYHDNFVVRLEARLRVAERVIAAMGDTPEVAAWLESLSAKEPEPEVSEPIERAWPDAARGVAPEDDCA